MKNITFRILFSIFTIISLGCNSSDKYNIVFRYQHYIVVDFKTKMIDVEMIKYKTVLELSKDEENKIYSAFNKSGIGKLKGEVIASDSLPITPIIYSEFRIYHKGILKSSILIDDGYKKKQNSVEEEDRIADFRDAVKKLLDKNRSFKFAKDSLERYTKQHNLFYL